MKTQNKGCHTAKFHQIQEFLTFNIKYGEMQSEI